MIFATIGNDRRSFDRFNKLVLLISDLFPNLKIVYQKGHNKFINKKINIYDKSFFDRKIFSKYLKESTLVFTHAGAGTLLQLSKLRKVPYVLPRDSKFLEHVNDHQIETLDQFKSMNMAKEIDYPFDVINLKKEMLIDMNNHLKKDPRNNTQKKENPLLLSIRNDVEKYLNID